MSSGIDWEVEGLRFVFTLVAAGVGAWFSVYKFSLAAKEEERRRQREIEAEDIALSTLSDIVFLSFEYANYVFLDAVRVSGLSEQDIQKRIYKQLARLHSQHFSLGVNLSPEKSEALQSFVAETKDILNEANSNYGLWYSGDQLAEQKHSAETISQLGVSAEKHLKVMGRKK